MKLSGLLFLLGIASAVREQSVGTADGTGVDGRVKYRPDGIKGQTKSWRGKNKKSSTGMSLNSQSPQPAAFFFSRTFVDIPPPPTPSSGNSSIASMQTPIQIGGIFPNYSVLADTGPKRSECGIGALMAWADNLYLVSYLSVPDAGSGTGLYVIDGDNYQMRRLVSHQSTYANRIIHKETNQIVIGAWLIDQSGNLKTFEDLLHVRVAATAEHLTDPANKVYMLGMDGPLWECDVNKLNCTQLFDLVKELDIPSEKGEQPHFKAAHTMDNRLVVASNTFEQADLKGEQHGGRLAEWKGPGSKWTILARTAFVEVTGRRNFGKVIYAVGWDKRSAILKVFDGGDEGEPSSWQQWQTYRLPKASHAFDHLWQTEWPRIREVETERYLMDAHGMFYELSPLGWAGSTWGIRPISQHLRVIPDFASFRGTLVLGGNQVSSIFDNNVVTGQSQSGMWFGKTDDLWSFGKPQGWGAVWRRDNVTEGVPSDPYLMTGFDHKVLHLTAHVAHPAHPGVTFAIEIDYTGTAGHMSGEDWNVLTRIGVYNGGYNYYTFPPGFSAHWVRVVASANCTATAYFHYT
ncbi:LOW QUALITY PROTEIN: uncharacterized protein LOC135477633 [Liolophura sinensis]|uniref:LOW QUALITY PROTEIN: uncharacterized protein LOC135477633 n=1 Tax=Liolophura sinensis TaxID=3198878 RepID=UPI0031590B35